MTTNVVVRHLVATLQLATWHLVWLSMTRLGGMRHLLTWDGHDLATLSVVVALWRSLDGGGGWVASLMVVVGRKQRRGNV